MRYLLPIILTLYSLPQISVCQLPLEPINCEAIASPPILDILDPVGATKILWVVCAPDSDALRPLEHLPIHRAEWCSDPDSVHGVWRDTVRVMYPSTYTMPHWKDQMLDLEFDRSLSSYYVDISLSVFWPYGHVVGATDSTIFLCDPDTTFRPLQPYACWGNSGGAAFFLNIMQKVDSVVDFSDYDVDENGNVDFLIFHIYGLAEDGNHQGTGGVAGLPAYYCKSSEQMGHIFS